MSNQSLNYLAKIYHEYRSKNIPDLIDIYMNLAKENRHTQRSQLIALLKTYQKQKEDNLKQEQQHLEDALFKP
jgi:hypothetical protein